MATGIRGDLHPAMLLHHHYLEFKLLNKECFADLRDLRVLTAFCFSEIGMILPSVRNTVHQKKVLQKKNIRSDRSN